MSSSSEIRYCFQCQSPLQSARTSFSLFFKEGDILIKNYPVSVCPKCGEVEISPVDRKRTVRFIKEHKKRYFKSSL